MTSPALAALAAAGDPADPRCTETLSALGFRDPERAWRNLRRLVRYLPAGPAADALYAALERALPACTQADRALDALERLLGDAAEPLEIARRLSEDDEGLARLLHVCAVSEFLARTFARDAALLGPILLDAGWDEPVGRTGIEAAWAACAAAAEDVHRALRAFKRRMLAQIGVQDVLGVATVAQTLDAMTAYAEYGLQHALAAATVETAERHGQPWDAQTGEPATLSVLALGKFGGGELNYSSDIDLIFLYSGRGETVPLEGGRPISNAEFFARVGERLIKLLTAHERGGWVFRVDMRLRPMGGKSHLVHTYDGMLEYYESWGRTWERQMLIKARPVAGDLDLGRAFLDEVRPFIYPKYLDLKAIREVHGLKRTIEERAERQGDAALEVKTGYGGIRDIEFTVQFLQLLNGGRRPALRTTNTLRAIAVLREAGLLARDDAHTLTEAYEFLRKTENRLQLWEDRQVHRLPDDPTVREAFAAGLGFERRGEQAAWEAFHREYRRHTTAVRQVYQAVLGEPFEEAPIQAPIRRLLLLPGPGVEDVARALAPYGLHDPETAWNHLAYLASGPPQAPLTESARQDFAELAPAILQHVAGTPDPDHTLQNVRRCLDAFGTPGVFYAMLLEKPKAVEVFVSLASFSETLIRILLADPGMLDFLIRDTMLERPSRPKNIARGLDKFLEINPDFYTAVRRYKNGEILRIGLRDMLNLAPITEVTEELSYVADVVIDHLWAHEAAELTQRYGSPLEPDTGEVAESVVLALGKCGGQDLNYTSDLDVAFVYSLAGETAGGLEAPITNQEYFLKLAARVAKLATQASAYGSLYKLDARLRPHGGQGVLALTQDEYVAYYRDRADLWEHQALLRLRPMAGSLALGRRIVEAVNGIIYAPEFWRPEIVDKIHEMLQRVQEHGRRRRAGLSLKHEVGGIVEVEFLVQLLMLRHGAAQAEVRQANTLRAIDALAEIQALSAMDAQQLRGAYEFLRRTENRLRIMHGLETAALPDDARQRDLIALHLQVENRSDMPDGQVLAEKIEGAFHRVHAIYGRTLGALRGEARG